MILEEYFILYCIILLILLLIAVVTHIVDRLKYRVSGWLDLGGVIILAIEYSLYYRLYMYAKNFTAVIMLAFEIVVFALVYKCVGAFAINHKK